MTTAGDVDGDGDIDIIIGEKGYTGQTTHPVAPLIVVKLARSNADGTFAPVETIGNLKGVGDHVSVGRLSLRDIDGDGDLDVVASPRAVLRNDGSGSFGAPEPLLQPSSLPRQYYAKVEADFNEDGRIDLLVSAVDLYNSVEQLILFGQADGSFEQQPPNPDPISLSSLAPVTALDFDKDGDDDLVAYGHVNGVYGIIMYKSKLNGTFAAAKMLAPVQANVIGTGRFNDDLARDLVFAWLSLASTGGSDGNLWVEVWLNDGEGGFLPSSVVWAGTVPKGSGWRIQSGDFTGDGQNDVAVVVNSVDGVHLLTGDGEGGLSHAGAFLANNKVFNGSLTSVDMDGDGDHELLTSTIGRASSPGLITVVHGAPGPFVDLGFGMQTTQLAVVGNTAPGASVQCTVSGLPAGSVGFLFTGVEQAMFTFSGGVVVVQPLVVAPLLVDVPLELTWPSDLETGTTILGQAWMLTPTGELLASNAVAAVSE